MPRQRMKATTQFRICFFVTGSTAARGWRGSHPSHRSFEKILVLILWTPERNDTRWQWQRTITVSKRIRRKWNWSDWERGASAKRLGSTGPLPHRAGMCGPSAKPQIDCWHRHSPWNPILIAAAEWNPPYDGHFSRIPLAAHRQSIQINSRRFEWIACRLSEDSDSLPFDVESNEILTFRNAFNESIHLNLSNHWKVSTDPLQVSKNSLQIPSPLKVSQNRLPSHKFREFPPKWRSHKRMNEAKKKTANSSKYLKAIEQILDHRIVCWIVRRSFQWIATQWYRLSFYLLGSFCLLVYIELINSLKIIRERIIRFVFCYCLVRRVVCCWWNYNDGNDDRKSIW